MSNDADNSNMSRKSHKVLPLSEKMKAIYLMRKEKKSYAVARISSKNKSSIYETVKKKKKLLWFCCGNSNYKGYAQSDW